MDFEGCIKVDVIGLAEQAWKKTSIACEELEGKGASGAAGGRGNERSAGRSRRGTGGRPAVTLMPTGFPLLTPHSPKLINNK